MKKTLLMALASLLTIGLMACGDSGDAKTESGLTAAEVYEQTFEAMEDMESATTTIDINQDIGMSEQDLNVEMDMGMDGEIITDTNEMHQNMEMSLGGEGLGGINEDIAMEFYVTEDAFYLHTPENDDDWVKLDSSELDMLDGMLDQQEDPTAQIEVLEEFSEDLSLEEDDNNYELKLTADADAESFDELIEKTIGDSIANDMMGGIGGDFDITEDMEVHDLTYEMVIDKETFHLVNFDLNMDLTIKIEGESADLEQTMSASYEDINEIDAIEVPQDIVDNAIEQ